MICTPTGWKLLYNTETHLKYSDDNGTGDGVTTKNR